jgi:peptidoglycan/LPS O-acetylase OafA/YrhL
MAAIAVTWIVERNPPTPAFAGTLILNLLFLFQLIAPAAYLAVGWSLGVEVWLYALAPLFLRLRARTLEILIACSFLCYIFYTGGRSLFHWPYYSNTLYGINLFCLAYIWIAGFYLSVSPSGPTRPLRFVGCLFLGHLFLTLAIQLISRLKNHNLPDFVGLDLPDFFCHGALLLLVYGIFWGIISHRFRLTLVARRGCRFLGDISYPLYLVHLPAFILLARYTQSALALVIGALLLATIVYFVCDSYSRRRKVT